MIKSLQESECFFLPQDIAGNQANTEAIGRYLRVMFMPLIKKYFPQHYLIKSKSKYFQSYLNFHSQTHRYFLRFNVDQLYLKVTNYFIGPVLLRNFEELYGSSAPKHMYQHLETGPDLWFSEKPWSTALPNEKELLCFAVGTYLLGLCIPLSRWPFLCYHHEFIVLFQSKVEIDECLSLVLAELERLKLRMANDMICSGEINLYGFTFMDFAFRGANHTPTQIAPPHPENNEIQIQLQKNKFNIKHHKLLNIK